MKYKHGIERIEKDFIESGYEQFLWKPSTEEWACMRRANERITNYSRSTHILIHSFIEQIDKSGVNYIFPKRNCATYLIIQEVCKQAKSVTILNNIFPEDETVNYLAVFDIADTNSITLMNHLAYSGYMSDVFGGYKLFNYSLPYYADFCADDDGQYLLERPNKIMHFLNYQTRRDTKPFIIYDVRKNIEFITKKYFTREFDLFYDFNYTLLPFLQKLFMVGVDIENKSDYFDWQNERDRIKKDLILNKLINSKWKNELSLYILTQTQYPDAIYQFRPNWLSPQSLDIYIPCKRIAIEYQGIQHYEPVDFFGGKEAYKRRLVLDKNKANLCKKNNIILITWDYNEEINLSNLRNVISLAAT